MPKLGEIISPEQNKALSDLGIKLEVAERRARARRAGEVIRTAKAAIPTLREIDGVIVNEAEYLAWRDAGGARSAR